MAVEQLLFTDRPRGGGLEPSKAGYQISGCSPGLDAAARDLLGVVCMHYGDAVHRSAPQAARDREAEWLNRPERTEPMPPEVLDAFPVIWSYDRLRDDLYALTRVRYAGFTHDNRLGNFLAHTLVFPPQALADHGHNPLALTRTGLFRMEPGGALKALPDLGPAPSPLADGHILAAAPYGRVLSAMAAALCAAAGGRPLVLGLPDADRAVAVVEALLALLPPSARCRTTVCTYENDRAWNPSPGPGRPAGPAAAHQVMVLGGDVDRTPLRADEVQSTYAVFHFATQQFSPAATRPFAELASACVRNGDLARLAEFHDLVERLGCGRRPEAWDALTPVAALFDGASTGDRLAVAVRALTKAAGRPAEASAAQEALVPTVRRLAAGPADGLAALAPDLAALADRAPPPDPLPDRGYFAEVRALARDALRAGRASVAAALLDACGAARPRQLVPLLGDALAGSGTAEGAPAEQRRRIGLLVEGLRLRDRDTTGKPPFEVLLVGTFQAAADAGLTADVWGDVGDMVKARLDGAWNSDKQDLSNELLRRLTPERCPDGAAWVSLKLLKGAPPEGEDLLRRLEETARASAVCRDAPKLIEELTRIAQQRLPADRDASALALGRMAEAAHGTPSWTGLYEAFRQTLERLPPGVQRSARQKLALGAGRRALCHELLGRVLPWDDRAGQTLREWWGQYLEPNPALLDVLGQETAERLGREEHAADVWPLAWQIVHTAAGKPTPGNAGYVALCGAVAMRLPLEPPDEAFARELARVADAMPAQAAARLRVLRFLGEIGRRTDRTDGSLANFPHADAVWSKDVRGLSDSERGRVVSWCLARSAAGGVAAPQDAKGLIEALRAVGVRSGEEIADAAENLLRGRDAVTRVLVGAAFARGALEGDAADGWADVVTSLVGRWDKATRKLLADHLWKRFGRRDDRYAARLRQLCANVGLPDASPPPQMAEGEELPPEGGLLGFLSGLFGGRRGGEDKGKDKRH